ARRPVPKLPGTRGTERPALWAYGLAPRPRAGPHGPGLSRTPADGDDPPEATTREPTMSVSLDASQRKQIERRRQQTRDYRLAMRLSAVLWRDEGQTESDIAHLLGVCERT